MRPTMVSNISGSDAFNIINFCVHSKIKLKSNEVTTLAKQIHQKINQESKLSNEELQWRISVLEDITSKNQLLPKRSLWHLASFGISYVCVKIYDQHRANTILEEKQQLIDKYLAQMLTSLEPSEENCAMLSKMLDHGTPKNTKEILKYALKHNHQELLKKCRAHPIENSPEEIEKWNLLISTTYDVDSNNEQNASFKEATKEIVKNNIKELIANGIDVNIKIHGKTALEIACETDDTVLASHLIQAGAHIDKYALLSAISKGQNVALTLMKEVDLDIESPNHFDHTRAILIAIEKQEWEMVRELIKKGVNLNVSTTYSGYTPLTLAIEKGAPQEITVEIIKALVKAGVSLNTTPSVRIPPALVLAASKGQLKVVKELLQQGAQCNARVNAGSPIALDGAIKNGHEEVALYLIENNAVVNSDRFRMAWQNNLPKVALAIREKMLALPSKPLPKYKLPVPGNDIYCEKPPISFLPNAFLAPKLPPMLPLPPPPQGYSKMLASLEPTEENIAMLHKIVTIGAAEHRKEILKYALRHNHQELIKQCRAYRIENSPEEIAKWKKLISTLYDADNGEEDKYATFKELLENGIDVNIKSNGKTALEIAFEHQDEGLASDLIQAGAHIDERALISAIAKGFGAKLLIEAGVNLNAIASNYNECPILMAMATQDWLVVLALINKGVDLHVHTPHTHFTPLTLAIEQGADLEVIHAIINALSKAGVSLDTEFDNRPSALILAASKGRLDIVEILLNKGARCDTCARATQLTALESAIENGHEKVALYLLAQNAPISKKIFKAAKRKNLLKVASAIRNNLESSAKAPVAG